MYYHNTSAQYYNNYSQASVCLSHNHECVTLIIIILISSKNGYCANNSCSNYLTMG